jgi:hypothetical protein
MTLPQDGPSRGLPLGVGAVEYTLLLETKSNPTIVAADVVTAFTTLSGLSPGGTWDPLGEVLRVCNSWKIVLNQDHPCCLDKLPLPQKICHSSPAGTTNEPRGRAHSSRSFLKLTWQLLERQDGRSVVSQPSPSTQ